MRFPTFVSILPLVLLAACTPAELAAARAVAGTAGAVLVAASNAEQAAKQGDQVAAMQALAEGQAVLAVDLMRERDEARRQLARALAQCPAAPPPQGAP